MKRLITQKLIEWSNNPKRKPLLLRGARQVGKTFSVKEFGEKFFKGNLHLVDLEKHPEWCSIFQKDLGPTRIVNELELILNTKINLKKDIVFFDEIQSCPRALLSLRYFYEDLPELRIIAAGSLLEFAFSEISFPVGRVQTLTMYPMNFVEFLLATGKDLIANKLLEGKISFSTPVHEMLLEELKKYFFVGGMPEAVLTFVETGKLQSAFEVHRDLLLTFRNDFSKYGKFTDTKCLDTVLLSAARYVGSQIKYSKLGNGCSTYLIKRALEILTDIKVLHKVPAVSQVGVPLAAFASTKKFKIIFLDVGLFQSLAGIPVDFEFRKNNLLDIYNGMLAEQFVGQELLANGKEGLYYWSRENKSSNAEIDFLIIDKGEIKPIEVKSGAAGRLKSLHLFLKTIPEVKWGYVLQQKEYGELPGHKLKFLPLYSAGNL